MTFPPQAIQNRPRTCQRLRRNAENWTDPPWSRRRGSGGRRSRLHDKILDCLNSSAWRQQLHDFDQLESPSQTSNVEEASSQSLLPKTIYCPAVRTNFCLMFTVQRHHAATRNMLDSKRFFDCHTVNSVICRTRQWLFHDQRATSATCARAL
jgi:hypothetical protein